MVNPDHAFHIADYCIFAVTIIVSLGIGIYYALSGGKQRTTSEYFVGNRQMSIIPVAISLMVSFESSIMMLGTPAEVYVYGFQWLIGNIGWFIANLLSILIVVPLLHPLKITSAYEYLEMRFESRVVRTLGTVLGMLGYTCYMGIVLFGPAIALEGVTGLPQWVSIVSVTLASVIYTSIGGLKAVIWTDVFQCGVMFAGFFAVLIRGTMQIGGVAKTWEIANDNGRLNFLNFDPDPTVRHTFWNLIIGSMIRGFGLVFNQSSVQRISSTPTIKDARKVLLFVAPGFFLSLTLAGIEGIIAYSYYDSLGCDPLKSKQISNPNQIVPYMVMDIFDGMPGMPGLFMASLFSASLSTLSSGLSSMSALFYTDLIKPHVKPMSEFKATIISKLSVVVFGILAAVIAFLIAMVGGTLIQISGSILSAFGGPLTGLFMFGAFCPWGNAKGAMIGTIISAITTFTVSIGQMTTEGAVKNQKLPSGPIDSCPMTLNTDWTNLNTTLNSDWLNGTGSTVGYYTTSLGVEEEIDEPTGFRRLFMMSYTWFAGFGILQVFVFGTLFSFLTGRKMPGEVHRKFLIPFFDSIFPFLPECILRPLRCGYYHNSKMVDTVENGEIEYIKVDKDGERFNYDLSLDKPDDPENSEKLQFHNTITPVDNLTANLLPSKDVGDLDKHDYLTDVDAPKVHNIKMSMDNLTVTAIPVKDMEFEIRRIQNSDLGSNASVDEHKTDHYITFDKMEEVNALRFKARSIEFDIDRPYNVEVPEINIIPPHLTET